MVKKQPGSKNFLWVDIVEGGGVVLALPFLMFPTVKPLLTVLCLLGLCVMWVLSTVARHSPWPETPFNGAMLLFSVMVAVAVGISAFPDLSLLKAAGLISGMAMWRFLSYAVKDKRRLRWAVAGFIILCLGMTAIGILATDWPSKVPFLGNIFSLLPDQLLDLPESASTKHANQLGGAMLIYYPLMLSATLTAWIKNKRWTSSVLYGIAAAVVTALLVFTQSRSTWIGASISIFC
ncbi:MAG: hypothetical protein P1S60_20735, partial [Anaerolineae bacterium]|nr:hypothetical protein [Anaerolineae bacterium]